MPSWGTVARRRPAHARPGVWLVAVVLLLVPMPATRAAGAAHAAGVAGAARTLHVSAGARPGGDGSAARPYARVAQAVRAARAGDTVLVGRGRYAEYVATVRPGRRGAPIRLVGRPGAHLVGPQGAGRGRLLQVRHDHVTVAKLELSHAGKLVWVQRATGVRILGNRLHDAGGECVRLKDRARANEVAGNLITRCGRVGFRPARGSKNGEGVYIGTAPEQADGVPDRSDGNRVHHNRITPAAECVEVKEWARGNRVEHNRCSGSDDPDGAGFSSRGDHTTFRANRSTGHAGAGIRLGGDTRGRGLHNHVIGNTLAGNAGYGLKVLRSPQGRIAANTIVRNGRGARNRSP